MSNDIIGIFIFVYIIGLFLSSFWKWINDNPYTLKGNYYEPFIWPVIFLKGLLKTLHAVLFTNWKY